MSIRGYSPFSVGAAQDEDRDNVPTYPWIHKSVRKRQKQRVKKQAAQQRSEPVPLMWFGCDEDHMDGRGEAIGLDGALMPTYRRDPGRHLWLPVGAQFMVVDASKQRLGPRPNTKREENVFYTKVFYGIKKEIHEVP